MKRFIEQLEPLVIANRELCLLPDEVGIYQFACCFEPDSLSQRHADLLPEEVREYLNNLVSKRRTEFLAGRYCATQAIHRASLTANQWVERASNSLPLWPDGLIGSISHSGNRAIAVVTHRDKILGIGIDVEDRMPQAKAEKLADRILAGYPRCDSFEEMALLITLTFSIKESLYKALYPLGVILGGFDSADIVEWDHTRGKCRVELRLPAASSLGLTKEFSADYAYNDTFVQSRVTVYPPE